ncbi:MAG: carbohydrate ABC transporter permease, partial [Acidobacteriota bacterium]
MRRSGRSLLLHAVLIAGAAATLAPLVWMVSASVMPSGEANTFPPRFFPTRPTLAHYGELFSRLDLGRAFGSSVFVAAAVTAVSLLFNSMAGYAFAKLRFRGRDRLFGTLLAAMVIPTPVAMLPLFLMLRELGLVNSYAGVIVPAGATILGVFLIYQFARGLPDDLIAAARLEGASELQVYWKIVLPLLRPVLATLGIVT